MNLVVIRENLEDLYAGIEFAPGSGALNELAAIVQKHQLGTVPGDAAVALKVISASESQRIARFAFEYARAHGRHKVTVVHKGNNLKLSDGSFLETAGTVSSSYPDIALDDYLIDNIYMQLVRNPETFDVILAPNLYGDILSDLTARAHWRIRLDRFGQRWAPGGHVRAHTRQRTASRRGKQRQPCGVHSRWLHASGPPGPADGCRPGEVCVHSSHPGGEERHL